MTKNDDVPTTFTTRALGSGFIYTISIGGDVTALDVGSCHLEVGTLVLSSDDAFVQEGTIGIIVCLCVAREDYDAVRTSTATLPTKAFVGLGVDFVTWLMHLYTLQGTRDVIQVHFEGRQAPVFLKPEDIMLPPARTTISLETFAASI